MPLKPRTSSLAPMKAPNVNRSEFVIADFQQLIEEHGYYVLWYKSMECPNFDPAQPDHHMVDCSVCDHNGRIYYDEVDTQMALMSFSAQQTQLPEGRYEPGQVYVTSQPGQKLSFFDKIVLKQSRERYSERIIMSPNKKTYTLHYAAIGVDRVVNGPKATEFDNYTLNNDGTITFNTLPSGPFSTISYYYRPVFILIDILHRVRDMRETVLGGTPADQQLEYPTQGVGKLDFLIDQSNQATG